MTKGMTLGPIIVVWELKDEEKTKHEKWEVFFPTETDKRKLYHAKFADKAEALEFANEILAERADLKSITLSEMLASGVWRNAQRYQKRIKIKDDDYTDCFSRATGDLQDRRPND